MSDVKNLTPEQLRDHIDSQEHSLMCCACEYSGEIQRRLERLEQREAALRVIISLCGMHKMNSWTMECTNQWCKAARAAVERK